MEARKITIVSTKTQKKNVIMSEAETLRQLKDDLRNAGIDFNDMTFYEGVSKTELRHDDSILPSNIPYTNRRTGETINTNELVFMLTNQNKKIKSGAEYARTDCYIFIKERNLQELIKKAFGKNFTQCSTADLNAFISSHDKENAKADKGSESVCESCEECVDHVARKAIRMLVKALEEVYDADEYILDKVAELMSSAEEPERFGIVSPYSDEELDEMLDEMY